MSSSPTRFTSGVTQAASFQPNGQIGIPDPFFYAVYADDFLPYRAVDYTVTATGGSVAAAAGDGGRILFTTGATINNFASIQQPVASFQLLAGSKVAFACRVQFDDISLATFSAGLIQTTATPATVTNGIVFTKATGGTTIVCSVYSGSTVIGSATLPAGLLTNATDIDLAFHTTRKGGVAIYAGYHLFGNKPNQNRAALGPVARILANNLTAALPTTLLNPTLNVAAGTAVARTMTADFLFAAKER